MNLRNQYRVQSIPSKETHSWLLKKHYAHRIPLIINAFGLYDKTNILQGICTFGPPPRAMNDGEYVFNNYKVRTLELNRLCVNDNLPKNVLSYFLSRCLKCLSIPLCVVSFADFTRGHQGYIYQATNWIYTGLNQIHEREIFYKGKEVHPRSLTAKGITNITEWAKNNEEVKLGEYTHKHRYFQFLGTKKEKKEMRSKLKYPIFSYPKGDNKRYDASYKPEIQQVLF